MELLFNKIFEVVSIEYMFSVILATYFGVKLIELMNGNQCVHSWIKVLISCVVGVAVLILFCKFTEETFQCLITSFFAAIVLYDKAIKFLIEKFDIGYKK